MKQQVKLWCESRIKLDVRKAALDLHWGIPDGNCGPMQVYRERAVEFPERLFPWEGYENTEPCKSVKSGFY